MNQASSHWTSVGGEFVRLADLDACLAQQTTQFAPHALLIGQQGLGAELDLGKLLRGSAAVGRHRGDTGLGLTDQASDANGIEFVEVGGADRDEAHTLEQRMTGVLGFLHDAVVEVQPGQFAVDEAVGADGRDRPRGDCRGCGSGGLGAGQDIRRAVCLGRRLSGG